MSGLTDLLDSMERAKLQAAVTHLAIVAHGDSPGTVEFERPLTSGSIPQFTAEFERLKQFLTRDAWLTFYSCIAGKDEPGSRLLAAVSRRLPGRTIVGFELFGLIGPPGALNTPGTMTAIETPIPQLATNPRAQHGNLNPWCPFAKRARDGIVVHLPLLEQNGRFGKRCANPSCPGHASPSHSCNGW